MGFFENMWRSLFDFSAGQEEGCMFERMIHVALVETHTEKEFLALIYQMLKEDDYLKTETRWSLFMIRMSEYAHGRDKDWRLCAERLLRDMPKLYGYKREAALSLQPPLWSDTEPPAA
ncbi:MAG: hypothetical protein ACRYFS_20605 [Janthinobacterium lividum]